MLQFRLSPIQSFLRYNECAQACVSHLRGWTDARSISKTAVDTITSLALEGNHLCRMLAGQGAVAALLSICSHSPVLRVRVSGLRALGTVCCVLEGIREFEREGGVALVVGLLAERGVAEEERSEAAGVLAQITSPWIENNTNMLGVTSHMGDIVAALTGEHLINMGQHYLYQQFI